MLDDFLFVKKYAINLNAVRYVSFDDNQKHVAFYFDNEHRLLIEDPELYKYLKNPNQRDKKKPERLFV